MPAPTASSFARVGRFLRDTTPPAGSEAAMLPLYYDAHDMANIAMDIREALDVEERITRVVSHSDLDRAIQDFIGYSSVLTPDQQLAGSNFECVADQEWSNDSNYNIVVEEGGFDSYDNDKLTKFLNGEHQPYMLSILTKLLANAGALSPGRYQVEVRW